MKKILFALAALVLAFTGCSQEGDAIQVSEKKAVKVVVNMDKPGFGTDARAARQSWEDGDEVVVALGDNLSGLYSNGYIKLIYSITDDKGSWTAEIWDGALKSSAADFLGDLSDRGFSVEGSVKAAYFSSGVVAVELKNSSFNITTKASTSAVVKGECVMTCEDGTYSFVDGVLTLDITMIPQVAQFTIRNLEAGENGVLSTGVGVDVDNLISYAGGSISASGIALNQVADTGAYNTCWVYPNDDGISIYAAVDSEYVPAAGKDFIYFKINDNPSYRFRKFGPYATYKAKVTKGAAIIMNGPVDEFGGNGWVSYY